MKNRIIRNRFNLSIENRKKCRLPRSGFEVDCCYKKYLPQSCSKIIWTALGLYQFFLINELLLTKGPLQEKKSEIIINNELIKFVRN